MNYQPQQFPNQQHGSACPNCGFFLMPGQSFCPNCKMPVSNGAPMNNQNPMQGAPYTQQPDPGAYYAQQTPQVPPQGERCSNCGNIKEAGQDYCVVCGTRTSTSASNTGYAQNSYGSPDQYGAPNQYGAAAVSTPPPKKKKIWIPIVIAIVLALAIVGGLFAYNYVQEQKIEEYKQLADEFYSLALSSGVTMEDIGNEIHSSWKAYVTSSYYRGSRYYSVNSAVSAAQNYMYDDISSVENDYWYLEGMYEYLLEVPDTSDYELVRIKNAVVDVWDAYVDLYNCTIDPSGNYTSWSNEFSDADTALAEAIRELSDALY